MSGKIAGALLLLLACAMICCRYITEKRRAIRLAEAFAAALCRMEGMIRWQNLPLPRVLEQESKKTPCGEYFSVSAIPPPDLPCMFPIKARYCRR